MEFILNIGILGYGTVGQSVADILHERDCGVRVQWILRRAGKAVGPQMTDNFENLLLTSSMSVTAASGYSGSFAVRVKPSVPK